MVRPSICSTAVCAHAASSIIQNFAKGWEQMDPCTRLPLMVCGGAREAQKPGYSVVGQMREQNLDIIKSVLDNSYDSEFALFVSQDFNHTQREPRTAEAANHKKLKGFYRSCMNKQEVEQLGSQPLRELLRHLVMTLWPVDETQDGRAYNHTDPVDSEGFADAQTWLHSIGVGPFFRNAVFPSAVTKDVTNLVFLPPRLGIRATTADAIASYTEEVAALLTSNEFYPGDLNPDNALKFASQVANMEAELLKVHPGQLLQGHVHDGLNEIPYAELLDMAPHLAIDKLIQAKAPANYTPVAVAVMSPSYMANASAIVARQTVPTLQLFMFVSAVRELGVHTIHNRTLAMSMNQAREEYCLSQVEVHMRAMMDSFFIRTSHSDAVQQAATDMLAAIRSQFKKRIGAIDWISAQVKQAAQNKVDKVHQQVGYPTQPIDVTDPEAVMAHYGAAAITDCHFDNVMALMRLNTAHEWARLGKPLEHGAFEKPSWAVNAAYLPHRNSIELNAGIMRPPVFDSLFPSSVNYGILGAACGHELLHGFDNTGSRYDEAGLRRHWWDSESLAQGAIRSQCFVEQFGAYDVSSTDGTVKVDGERTLGENLADAGGLNLAFEAWRAVSSVNGSDTVTLLPGLEPVFNTPERQFFLAHASFFCDYPTSAQEDILASDPHPPNMARIASAMMNSKYFRRAFECPDLEPKCEMW